MKLTDREAFVEVVLGFAELKGKQLSAPALELYWRAMRDWDLDEFREAAEHLLRTCEFMPVPKDFEDLRKAGEPLAGEAWAIVLDYCKNGFYRWDDGSATPGRLELPGFDEPTLKAVHALGGFAAIAMHDTDKLHFLEKRFAEHYEAMSNADAVRDALPEIAQPRNSLPRSSSGFTRLGAPLED